MQNETHQTRGREDMKHSAYYREIKKFMLYNLNHRSIFCTINDPIDWVKTFLPLVSMCVTNEDYEGAAACKDAIREFVNQFLSKENKIKMKDMLKLPEYNELPIHGIICHGHSISGGHAEII